MSTDSMNNTTIPTTEEMRTDLEDPVFIAKMQHVQGFESLQLTAEDVLEAELFNQFLNQIKK